MATTLDGGCDGRTPLGGPAADLSKSRRAQYSCLMGHATTELAPIAALLFERRLRCRIAPDSFGRWRTST